MANKCDQCGNSFPNTAALVQHFGSCPAMKKAQEALGGKVVAKTAAHEGFQCPHPHCDTAFSRKDSFTRHLRETHNMSPVDALREKAKLPQDPRANCKYCGFEMYKKQLPAHYKICKKIPKDQGATAGATASQDLNVSRDSLVSRAGNLDIGEEPEIMSEEEFIKDFIKYMKNPSQGNLSGETPRLYRDKIIHFLNFWKGQSQNFSAGKLVNFGSKINFIQLPHSEEWEGTLGSGSNRSQGLSAYITLIRYLRFLNFKSLDQQKMDKREVYDRENHLNRMDFEAKLRNKNSNAQATVERRENEEIRENLPEGDKRKRVPGEELKRISDLYANSEDRKSMYKDLGERMEEVVRTNIHIPTDVRDFLAFEVLFTAGGMRADAIYKMKVAELYRARKTGDGKRAILGHEQKTKKSYGAAQLIIPERLYNLLILYMKHVRPLLLGTKKESEYVFITQEGTMLDRIKIDFFEKVNKANDGTFKIRGHDFRRLVATLAQESDDPTIRESQPLFMGHSQATVNEHYRTRPSKLAQHAANIDKLWAPGQGGEDLPSVEVDEDEIEQERARINREAQEKRDKEKSERDKKRRAAAPKIDGKFQFAEGDHDIIRRAFEFAKDCDGNQLGTITLAQGKRGGKSHFVQAYEKGGEFKAMVDRLVEEFKDQRDHRGRDIDFALIRTKIGDAYHAMQPRKGKKAASKSSGKGKAKTSKPGTSKEPNKSPAKKKQRGAAAYSDSDSEEEDSSQFSVEDSD